MPLLVTRRIGVLACLLSAGCSGTIIPGSGRSSPTVVAADAVLLPPRIRRLTRLEYDASVAALLGTSQKLGGTFPSELRQSGFTRNEAQVVDSTFALAAQQAADTLATEAVTQRLQTIAPCAAAQGSDACAKQFITTLGARAYRRPLTVDESAGLFTVYAVGAEDGYAAGVQLAISAMLQSAGFLYLTEVGSGNSSVVELTASEVASQLAFLFSGAPPDDELNALAASGDVVAPDTRRAQAERLLVLSGAHQQLQTLVMEWLSLDKINSLSKDTTLYAQFADRRAAVLTEAAQFTDDVFFTEHGDLGLLLNADFTVAPKEVTALYGLTGEGKVSLASTTRRGILGQSAFLSAFSNVSDSGPVHRGVAVMRRVTCFTMADPSELKIQVTAPPPDPTRTTRERFTQHATDATCAGCHTIIDGPGFSFEHFDAEGAFRTDENGKPVDSSGNITLDGQVNTFDSNVGLAEALSKSDQVSECFARNVHRFASAQSDRAIEDSFVAFWETLPAESRARPTDVLSAWAASPFFIQRGSR